MSEQQKPQNQYKYYEIKVKSTDSFFVKSTLEPKQFMEYLFKDQFAELELINPAGYWVEDNRHIDENGNKNRIGVDIDTYLVNHDEISIVGFLKYEKNIWDGKTTRLLSEDEI